jgi:hypothetical protein
VLTPANEVTRTYDCQTPECQNTARSPRGRHSYCVTCQTRRGGYTADGRVINSWGSPNTRAPALSGGHEERAKALVLAARNLDRAEHRAKTALELLEERRAAYRSAIARVLEPFVKTRPQDEVEVAVTRRPIT